MVKDTTDTLSPNFLIAMRFSIAFAVLAATFWQKWRLLDKSYLTSGAIIGLCLFCAYSLQTVGITDTTAGKNAFLTAVYCVIVPFLLWGLTYTAPDKYNIAASVICIIGIAMITLEGDLTVRVGDILTLGGGVFFAAHIVAIAVLVREKDPILITTLQFGSCAVFAWLYTFVFEDISSVRFNGETVFSIVYLAVMCGAVGMLFQNIAQKYLDPSSAALILSLEAVFGAIFSAILSGERFSMKIIIGFILIFAAIVISETKLKFTHKKSTVK